MIVHTYLLSRPPTTRRCLRRFQQDFYTAAAQYYQSEAVKEAALASGSGYGEEITRLRVAQRLIEAVLDTAQRQRMGPAIIGKAELVRPSPGLGLGPRLANRV